MKREEKIIKKVINYQLRKASEMAESICFSFKRLYFDIRVYEKHSGMVDSILPLDYKEIGISKTCLKDFIDMNFRRYNDIEKYTRIKGTNHKVKTKIEEFPMNMERLNLFFNSTCGRSFNSEEIEHLLHFIETDEKIELDKISNKDIYDLLIANTFFSNYHPQTIMFYVFDRYDKEEELTEPQIRNKTNNNYNIHSIM